MMVERKWAGLSLRAWYDGDVVAAGLYANYARFNAEFAVPRAGYFGSYAEAYKRVMKGVVS